MLKRATWAALVVVIALAGFTCAAHERAARLIAETPEQVGAAPVALVFGASVQPDKKPSAVLKDRVAAGVELLKEGRVEKLILSGDSRESHYNEPAAMKKAAIELGADPEQLLLDGDGNRTYDSCARAREVGGTDDVILVTQRFHLPRAIYLCRKLGLRPLGLVADRGEYEDSWRWELREWGAWLVAFADVL